MPTRGQTGRWQAITDTTTIESSLIDLKEKGATPQDRRFLYVHCINRTTAAFGCRRRNNRTRPPPAEPPRNVLRGTSRTGGECRFEGGDSGWKPGCRAAAGQQQKYGQKTGRKSQAFLGSWVKGARPDGGRVIDALFFSIITFSFFEATSVHCASDAATMGANVGCCVGSGTGNHFLEHWRTKLQRLVKYAARHVKHIISNVSVGASY